MEAQYNYELTVKLKSKAEAKKYRFLKSPDCVPWLKPWQCRRDSSNECLVWEYKLSTGNTPNAKRKQWFLEVDSKKYSNESKQKRERLESYRPWKTEF